MSQNRRWPRQVRMSDGEYRAACADAKSAGLGFGEHVRALLKQPAARKYVGFDVAQFVRRVQEAQRRLEPLLPDIDPHDLNLILERMLRPIGSRLFFIRKQGVGYVF